MPVVAAPLFLISNPDLVTACCKSGVVGTFPALNQRTSEGFEEWLLDVKSRLGEGDAPYGVNLIVHPTNFRLQPDLELCVKHKVPIVITSLGAVSDVVDAVHSYGGKVFHDVINRRHAEKAIAAGVDGLILVCAGAGGHAGTMHPMPFIHEIRSMFDGTILLSGCMSTGRDVASAMQMGADLAYMGTRFINATESAAPEAYRDMIINAGISDIVYTAAISGVNANFLRPSLEAAGITKELWEMKGKVDFGEKLDSEAKAWKTIWSAGQGVTSIHDAKPTADIVAELRADFIEAIKRQQAWLD